MTFHNNAILILSAVSVALLAFILFWMLKRPKQDPLSAVQPTLTSLQTGMQGIESAIKQGIADIGKQLEGLARPPVVEPAKGGPVIPPGADAIDLTGILRADPETPEKDVFGTFNPAVTYKYVWDPVTRRHKLVPSK